MAKDNKNPAETTNDLAELQAKHAALTDEVLILQERVDLLTQENTALKTSLAALSQNNRVTNSATIAPRAPAAPERPVVEINGEKYQFKMGSFRIGRSEVFATDVAADATILNDIFSKYPGLFRRV